MLYLEQTRNRLMFMTLSIVLSVVVFATMIQGINAVGVLLAASTINILVYYGLPDRYSKAYIEKHSNRIN